MWHGWLGHALRQVSEPAFRALYHQHDHEQPKPYAIAPGRCQKTEWQQGELLDFSLRLFGDACDLIPILLNAFAAGEKLGLGVNRTQVKVIAVVGNNGKSEDYTQMLVDFVTPEPHSACLLIDTPIRLKQRGHIIRSAEHFTVQALAIQSRRRLFQLTKYWLCDEDELLSALTCQPLGAEFCVAESALYFEDWQRFSLKQQEFMPFGGFKGSIKITSMSADLWRWLKIGEQLQLGGKTTFGLGCYRLVELSPLKL